VARPIGIGLLGCGAVGRGVMSILRANAERIAARAGGRLALRRIATQDVSKFRDDVEPPLLTGDPWAVVHDPDVEIVVELLGGLEPARTLIAEALRQGKAVVTANKAVLARHGTELQATAARHGAPLLFEAAVAGAIPIIKPLQECLAASRIQSILGIIDGMNNAILTGMARDGLDFSAALQRARQLGCLAGDTGADDVERRTAALRAHVEGYDAAFTLAILASAAFETRVRVEDVFCEGITHISLADIQYGRELGYVLKPLAIAKEGEGRLELRVHPAFIPREHPLAAVNDLFSAVFVRSDAGGELMLCGRGTGVLPAASAVVADIIEAAKRLRSGLRGVPPAPERTLPVKPIDEVVSRFYVALEPADDPGVLAAVAGAFGRWGIGIRAAMQRERFAAPAESFASPIDLVFLTHAVQEARLRRALAEIDQLDGVRRIRHVIRVEEPEPSQPTA